MTLTRPAGVAACLLGGEQGGNAVQNNRLRPENAAWNCFRTGVRLPSPPPDGHWTNTYYFKGGFAVMVWLWCRNEQRRSRC